MDKEEQQREMQNLAAAGFKGKSGTIFHANYTRDQQIKIGEDKRKNEQALLALAQEFADISCRSWMLWKI